MRIFLKIHLSDLNRLSEARGGPLLGASTYHRSLSLVTMDAIIMAKGINFNGNSWNGCSRSVQGA